DIDSVTSLFHEALALRSQGQPDHPSSLYHLTESLTWRYIRERIAVHIQEFAQLYCKLLPLCPEGTYLRSIASVLLVIDTVQTHSTSFQMLSNHVFDNAAALTTESIQVGREAVSEGHPYHDTYLNNLAFSLRFHFEHQGRSIYQHESALEAYQMCSELFDKRSPLENLESTSPDLAHKFSELSKCLSDAQGSAVGIDRAAIDRAETQYRRLTEQWGAVVAEIRNLESFSRFLLTPSYEELQAAACHGPVIILIASQFSCSALAVPTSGNPHLVRYPRLALTDLKKLKDDFAKAIKQATCMRPQEPRKDLRELLRIVWDEIMLPIVNVLEYDLKLRRRSRIWLCPIADFTLIPLHVANAFRMNTDGSELEYCPEDIYICSYTPTLSALIRAQQSMKKHVPPSFVAIGQGQPGVGQGKELLAVGDELNLICSLAPVTANPTTLSGDNATRAGALEALQQNTWVHLACHGKQDHEQPYNSHFAMRDTPLTLLDIMEKDIPHAEFAFLSACYTAVCDEETPDEVIHLAAGLQFSGFKSVIGTLWAVDDFVAKHVVKAFYEKMFEDLEDGDVTDCTKAAQALNHASYVVKEVPLEQRIFFIHIGV
ncbi:CHAT domain-containing protein, partial [Suillus subluteus]